MVAIASNTLRILTVDKLGELFNQTAIPLRYTVSHSIKHMKHIKQNNYFY